MTTPSPADMAAAFFSRLENFHKNTPDGFFAAGVEAERQRAALDTEARADTLRMMMTGAIREAIAAHPPEGGASCQSAGRQDATSVPQPELPALRVDACMWERLCRSRGLGPHKRQSCAPCGTARCPKCGAPATSHDCRACSIAWSADFPSSMDPEAMAWNERARHAGAPSPLVSRMHAAAADARRIGEAGFAQVMDAALAAIAIADERTAMFRARHEAVERDRDATAALLAEAKAGLLTLRAEHYDHFARKLIYREIEAEDGYQIGMGRTAERDDRMMRTDFVLCLTVLAAKRLNGGDGSWRLFWLKLARLSISAIESYDRGGASRVDP
jgi:hypothetical protein